MRSLLFTVTCVVWTLAPPAQATRLFPWMLKTQNELTHAECLAAMRHDSNYWWSQGACHMKFIRYAAGVVLQDTRAEEAPDAVMKKGELLDNMTQYRPKEGLYCGHGGYLLSFERHKASRIGAYRAVQRRQKARRRERLMAGRRNVLRADPRG